MMVYEDMQQLLGNTPLVRLNHSGFQTPSGYMLN